MRKSGKVQKRLSVEVRHAFLLLQQRLFQLLHDHAKISIP